MASVTQLHEIVVSYYTAVVIPSETERGISVTVTSRASALRSQVTSWVTGSMLEFVP